MSVCFFGGEPCKGDNSFFFLEFSLCLKHGGVEGAFTPRRCRVDGWRSAGCYFSMVARRNRMDCLYCSRACARLARVRGCLTYSRFSGFLVYFLCFYFGGV